MKKITAISVGICFSALIGIPVAESAQTCNQSIVATTADTSFIIRNDGTAIHNSTGLMWMRCSLGQNWDGQSCAGEAGNYSWEGALQAAQGFSFADHADWRLPNKNELESIIEESCNSPAVNERVFPATSPGYYWTSSPYLGLAHGAWSVDFGYGSVNASVKNGALKVRLVRGGR